MKIGATSCIRGRRPHTHIYRVDGGKKALVRAFLIGGSAPLRLDEDTPTIMAMAAVAVAEAAKTCGTPKTWVSSIDVGRMLIPSFVVRSY
jgi:hypothetical protein